VAAIGIVECSTAAPVPCAAAWAEDAPAGCLLEDADPVAAVFEMPGMVWAGAAARLFAAGYVAMVT
jgi:hypothetical protein